MKIQLINGHFTAQETTDLVSQLIQVKIKFLENKISTLLLEEDIKSMEAKIINLQNTLSTLRHELALSIHKIEICSEIQIKV